MEAVYLIYRQHRYRDCDCKVVIRSVPDPQEFAYVDREAAEKRCAVLTERIRTTNQLGLDGEFSYRVEEVPVQE